MSSGPLSGPELREILFDVLRTDSDLEAFLLDYFPAVKRNVSSGMTRTAKVSLLLENEDPEAVYAALRAAYPSSVKRIRKSVPGSHSPSTSKQPAGAVDVVVLTALGLEHQAVTANLTEVKEQVLSTGTLVDVGSFAAESRPVRVAVIEAGMGNNSATAIAQEAILHYHPGLLLFVGVAGGVKDVKVGDVVAATKVYGYESGKADREFLPRPDVGESSYRLLQRARAEARKTAWLERARLDANAPDAPRAFIGAIAAGSAVIASTKSWLYQFLRQSYGDTLAVEMEGRGFLAAAHQNRSEALIIRGISDMIDGKARAEESGSQPRAARHAAAFAFEIIAKSF